MRSSTLLSALFVAGTLSSPIVQKRDYVTEVDVVTVVAYVTEGAAPAAATNTAAGGQFYQDPAPTTSEAPAPVAPAPTSAAPPPPSSSEPPAQVAAPSSTPAAAPVQQAPAGNDYQSQALYHHNIHRANHSADPLSWDENLASYAQQAASSCQFQHNVKIGGGGYGQNLAGGSDPEHIGGSITERLYNMEMMLYKNLYGQDSPDMSNFENWGHFSQIVWKSTKSVGCYTQSCPNGVAPYDIKWFTVCNYSPPGNWAGEYHNVGTPLGHEYVSAPMW